MKNRTFSFFKKKKAHSCFTSFVLLWMKNKDSWMNGYVATAETDVGQTVSYVYFCLCLRSNTQKLHRCCSQMWIRLLPQPPGFTFSKLFALVRTHTVVVNSGSVYNSGNTASVRLCICVSNVFPQLCSTGAKPVCFFKSTGWAEVDKLFKSYLTTTESEYISIRVSVGLIVKKGRNPIILL